MRRTALAFPVTLMVMTALTHARQGAMNDLDRGRAEVMLQQVYDEVEKHYYDEKFHGVDLRARYEQYKKRTDEASTMTDALRVIAAFLAGLKDSHTFFEPPRLVMREDYGYVVQIIGDRPYIAQVRPSSDAAAKLHPGDEILALNGFTINRSDLWQFWYALNNLQPLTATAIKLRSPDGKLQDQMVQATSVTGKQVHNMTTGDTDFWNIILDEESRIHDLRQRYVETGNLLVWKMPAFSMSEADVSRMIALARKHESLILDLRENPGGSVLILEEIVGGVFDHEVTIAQRVGRKNMKPQVSKKVSGTFTGDMIVLVDSRSASAAELFARVMQLNHRATVIGDRTSGSVMEARYYPMQQGSNRLVFYGASITDADLIMADGQSLENQGVIPDETVLPSADDLAAGRDPVLSYAAAKLGVKLDPKAAGAFFPFEWKPTNEE